MNLGTGATLALFLVSAGCGYVGRATEFDPEELRRGGGWVAATNAPVILQKSTDDCGTAVLAMALAAWQVPTSPDEISKACARAPAGGISAGALRDFARRKGLQAFLIEGQISDLEHELSKGRPVIAGLVKPYARHGLTHYELVVALHPERQVIVTIDPARGWRQNTYEGFLEEWAPAKRPLLVLFRSPSQ